MTEKWSCHAIYNKSSYKRYWCLETTQWNMLQTLKTESKQENRTCYLSGAKSKRSKKKKNNRPNMDFPLCRSLFVDIFSKIIDAGEVTDRLGYSLKFLSIEHWNFRYHAVLFIQCSRKINGDETAHNGGASSAF